MKRWFPLLFLAACGPATGVAEDASVDALEAAAPLDAPSDTQPESAAPEASRPDVGPEAAACPDADGDGHRAMNCGGDDCDDNDALAYPGRAEGISTCTLRSSNCSGTPDLERNSPGADQYCLTSWMRMRMLREVDNYAGCIHPQAGRWAYGGCRWCPGGTDGPDCVCWTVSDAEHPCPVLR